MSRISPNPILSLQVPILAPESKFALGQEDCLYLNIFTPKIPIETPGILSSTFPVIVFIHGGAFCVGSNDSRMYGPEYLLDHGDIVFITINYR